ncbi:putative uncharacterized phage protein [Moritella viscosa]|nr:hypothetical protein [Moritella viscosa]CED59829.1 putative uncharacterized phage protein [Moritella viscosa]SHO03475.1 DNA-binding protein [Moritella viscosa]
MYLRILALFFVSFSLIAAPEATVNGIENNIKTLNKDVAAVKNALESLGERVNSSINNNDKLILQSHEILKGINKSIKRQHERQEEILNSLAQAKKINEQDVDLSLSLKSDHPAIWGNVFSVIASALITLMILKFTLAKETKTQIKSLQENLIAQTKLNNKQIGSQVILNQQQIDTQLKLSITQYQQAHLLTIDEFRQKWINTFREEISIFIGSIIAVKDFHQIENGFFHYWQRTKKAEKLRIDYYEIKAKKIKQSEHGLFVATKQLEIKKSDDYKDLLKHEREAKQEFEKYKDEYKEFKTLHVNVLQQKTKLLLMLNPNKNTEDEKITELIALLVSYITLGDRTNLPEKNIDEIDIKLKRLQGLVKNMLKGEWDRIQRKQPKIKNSSISLVN